MYCSQIRRSGRWLGGALFLLAGLAAAPASAQTLEITASNATVVRGGSYADTNFGSELILSTRASSDATYVRRILLKFDTETPIPLKTPIAQATLTLTVAGGNAETRTLSAYRIASSYEEDQATWNDRKTGYAWTPGGDLAERADTATVTGTVGSRVTFDVTDLVQSAVNGAFGSSRYSRIALVDAGASSKEGYREYYSNEAADASVRPVLTVTYGSEDPPVGTADTPPPPPPTTTTTGKSLRVLQWNLHHGVGTDGKYDIDRIATWMAKMKPDIIMLNEVEKFTSWGNEDQPARYKALVQSKTGKTWYSYWAQEFGAWSSNGKGSLILSTYPIESGARTLISNTRVISEARITVNGRTISLVLTHLDPYSQSVRLTQAKQVAAWAASYPENRILTGDMNAWPDQSSIAELNKTYNDSWAVAESKGTATAYSGLTPSGATKKGRIDYIFYSKGASVLSVTGSQVYDTRSSTGVMPSDHRPVVTTFLVR